ncbi:hypothetical protein ACFQVC_40120 [Streptomyces monticola]|uniref:Uncharacterized protein n=1 Tax=Streptomyces monticola TaxID=2666263 RepID=A0ABW2JW71_9ACTN
MSGISGAAGGLLGADAVISCPHGGRVSAPNTSTGALLVDGAPVATAAHGYVVTGCPHTVDGVPTPCVSVRWTAHGGGVTAGGVPVLLDSSAGECLSAAFLPQGPPVVRPTQRKVTLQ